LTKIQIQELKIKFIQLKTQIRLTNKQDSIEVKAENNTRVKIIHNIKQEQYH